LTKPVPRSTFLTKEGQETVNPLRYKRLWMAVVFLAASSGRSFAQTPNYLGEPVAVTSPVDYGGFGPSAEKRTDLTIFNFFSAGWDEDSSKRVRETGTPNLALLKVQTNFMEREFRVNYVHTDNVRSKKTENIDSMDALVAWALNRRFMIEVLGTYQWNDARKGRDFDGGTPAFVGRIQLFDTETSSYSFNFRGIAPNRGLGESQTTLSYGYGGFEDLGYWLNLNRVGLYHSALFNSFVGPGEPGAKHTNVSYDVTLAKTLTSPETPLLGNFTVFVETFGQTNLDGSNAGHTLMTITPAVRFNLGKLERARLKDNWLLFGLELPVVGPRPFDYTFRFSYITNF
jgi:hypothetical protein